MDEKADIIKDADGKSIVVVSNLRFRGRRNADWNIVEHCLKEYIGHCAENRKGTMFLRQEYRYVMKKMGN